MTAYKKKLIEVALPLEAINRASAREKSIRHGHPSTLHLWWARRPLATCRAVLFASIVDDPSAHPEAFPTEESQETERRRLFEIIEELVKWENSTNDAVLGAANAEILRSTEGNPPRVLDPFCGGGSIPLEAQRLGLEAHASDLNPVAVLITKALIEIPPKFAGLPPVHPEAQATIAGTSWRGARGLAEDVRYWGRWMRDEAEQRIGHLYPSVDLPAEHGGGKATPIAWLWARSVKCPNPACGANMPLVRSFALSAKKDKRAWVQPVVDGATRTVRFEVRSGLGAAPEGTCGRDGARCLVCGEVAPLTHVRSEAQAGRMSAVLMAIVAEVSRGRAYVAPTAEQEDVARSAEPAWGPEELVTTPSHDVDRLPMYGMRRWRDAFTNRQLVALSTLSDLVAEARLRLLGDAEAAIASGAWSTHRGDNNAALASDYADAVATYLGLMVSRYSNYCSSLCVWSSHPKDELAKQVFMRQAIAMAWDFAETNPFAASGGTFSSQIDWLTKSLEGLPAGRAGTAQQLDATQAPPDQHAMISTDPPYYDNIGYADLSDYFYVWLRHSLRGVWPDLFSTLLVPKKQELIASPYRFHGDRRLAETFFDEGMGRAFSIMESTGSAEYPITVYYAFKQAESSNSSDGAVVSTGWEKMLTGLLRSGLCVVGTWPVRTELTTNLKKTVGALASSIVLVCRRRQVEAPLASRREFLSALRAELPDALRHLQRGNIAPVDLAQASIGPGMAVFSRYSKVVESDGSAMSVRTALALINQSLDEIVAEQEGEFDADTRWAIAWFQEVGMEEGEFGRAELLSKAKNTAVQGMVEAGILESKSGRVRLLRREELDGSWDPATDQRLTVWEMTQHLIGRLDEGEASAAALARQLGFNAEVARDLAYRLYLVCERKKWAQEALAYNALVVAWPQIQRLAAAESPSARPSQTSFEV